MRTIYIVFTNKKLSSSELEGMKQYMFLCPYDVIQAGDMIEDNRYPTLMQVVRWSWNTSKVQYGVTLKTIEPLRLNGAAIATVNYSEAEQKVLNSIEARNISVTLEQAREWFNSDNSTLRTLALNAYTESELVGYDYIKSCVDTQMMKLYIPQDDCGKVFINSKLAILAKYFNGNWKKQPGEDGYYISYTPDKNTTSGSNVIDNIHILRSTLCHSAGIIYFKRREDAKRAIQILGKDIKYLFS